MKQKFEYLFDRIAGVKYNPKDKDYNISIHVKYMLDRTQSMFEYLGLPETIPRKFLELYLQTNGHCCIAEHKGGLYAFTGSFGDYPNAYYMPTKYIVSNPALAFSKSYTIDKDCIVMGNDSLFMGMLPMFNKYASMMVENELSINIATINARIVSLIGAGDDKTLKSAQEFIKKIIDGDLSVIGDNIFFDGVRTQPYASTGNTNVLTNLIELEQYLRASWFNDLGLNANYNMKRESLNSAESQLNDDMLLPLIDDMLRCRSEAVDKINDMFGTSITVSLASSWEDNQIEVDEAQDAIDSEPTETDEGVEDAEHNKTE